MNLVLKINYLILSYYYNNIINNINTVKIQLDNNSIVNDMLFRELILLFLHE